MLDHLLSILIWFPIAGGAAALAGGAAGVCPYRLKAFGIVVSVVAFALSLPLFFMFDSSSAAMQFAEDAPWIDRFNIRYGLGADGFSVLMILLNTFTTVLVLAACWRAVQKRVGGYVAAFLTMSGLTNGVFAATDAALFYVFWEATLIPLFVVIGVWGGERRVYAAIKFFLYTLLGSLLMLVAFLYLYGETGGFSIAGFRDAPLSMTEQTFLFFAFLAAFAVKVPMTPVHTWLPDAHVEAPTGGSIVLAAVMLKLGAYGFLRFSLPVAPDASQEFAWLMIALSLAAIVYIGLVALVQEDIKKLVAYSSVAHMGFVTLGFFLFDELGMKGGVAQMVSHGFVSGALFFGAGVVYERTHTRKIADYGGAANTMPKYAAFMMLFAMANAGLPGTSGFVGEFMVILAAVGVNFWIGLLCATTLITGAAYTLWMYRRVFFGEIANDAVRALKDAGRRELAIMALFAAPIMLMGLWPFPFLEVLDAAAENLLSHVREGKL
ncbi:MAG: complex I subunit 4 family protein [Gammaproteobacteria bacterium]